MNRSAGKNWIKKAWDQVLPASVKKDKRKRNKKYGMEWKKLSKKRNGSEYDVIYETED